MQHYHLFLATNGAECIKKRYPSVLQYKDEYHEADDNAPAENLPATVAGWVPEVTQLQAEGVAEALLLLHNTDFSLTVENLYNDAFSGESVFNDEEMENDPMLDVTKGSEVEI